MSTYKHRAIEFDLLRSLSILSAAILHFSFLDKSEFSELLALPFKFIYHSLFTVGALFFFTAGVMAYQIYLPAFRQQKALETSYKILMKGIFLLFIHLFYINFMRLATQTPIPTSSIFDFFFKDTFFLRVIFVFGFLYMMMPFLLFLIARRDWVIGGFLIITLGLTFIFNDIIAISNWSEELFFNRRAFHYALLPSLTIFFLGMLFSKYLLNNPKLELQIISLLKHKISLIILVILICTVLYFKLFFHGTGGPFAIWSYHWFFPIRESLVIGFSLLILRKMFQEWPTLKSFLNRKLFLCYGVKSLTAFVLSTGLVSIVRYPIDSYLAKVFILIIILMITYLVSSWQYDSDVLKKLNQ